MMERFRQLERREQIVLVVGALLAIVIIGWQFVWSPLGNGAEELRESVADKARLVVDLQRAAQLQSEPGPATSGAVTQSPVILIEETSRRLGLNGALTRRNPDGNDAISVSFRNAPFDIFVAWLIDLERTHGWRVEQASTSPAGQPGFVDGQVRLERI